MKKVASFLANNWGLLLVTALGFVPVLWFRKDLLIAGGDQYMLLNPASFTKTFEYVWNEKLPNAGGVLLSFPKLVPMLYYWSLLRSWGVTNLVIERLWIVALFLLPGVTMYYFISQIYKGVWARVLSSVLYMFNLFVLVLGPFQDNVKPVFIALPLMVALWIKGLEREKENYWKYAILISLCSFIYAGSNVNPPSLVVVPVTLFLYFLFHLITRRGIYLRSIKFAVASFFCYLLVNVWWLLNFAGNIIQESESIRKLATFSALGTGAITDFFRLLGSWGWRSTHYKMSYYPFARFYDEPVLLILSFLIPIAVFTAILLRRRDRYVIFFGILSLTGLFLSKGTAEPLGFIYQWIWANVPGFWVFREPFSKFSPITVFAYSVLLGIGVDSLCERSKQLLGTQGRRLGQLISRFIPAATLVVILVVAYPLLNGEVIWDYWNGSMRSFYAKVPDYWQEVGVWFSHQASRDGRVFAFPRGGYGTAYNWPNGFSTADDPATVLLDKPVLRVSSPMSLADDVVKETYNAAGYKRGDEFVRLLSLLNSKYILQENDLDWRYAPEALDPRQSNEFLTENFDRVASFGLFNQGYLSKVQNGEQKKLLHDALNKELLGRPALQLYQIKDTAYLPKLYVPQEIIYSTGGLETLSSAISFNDYSVRSGIYLLDGLSQAKNFDLKNIEAPNKIYYKPVKVDLVANKDLSVDGQENAILPNASILPDSPLYFLVKWKEKRLVDNEKDDVTRTDLMLWLSSKRLVEMEKLLDLGKTDAANRTFTNYYEMVKIITTNLETLSKERPEAYALVSKANSFFIRHKIILDSLRGKLVSPDEETKTAEVYGLYRNISALVSRANFKYYLINVNRFQEGYYNLFMRERQNSGLANSRDLEKVSLSLDKKKPVIFDGRPLESGWYRYPGIYIAAGYHEISLPNVEVKNLIDDGSFEELSKYKKDPVLEFSSDSVAGTRSLKLSAEKYQSKELSFPVNNLERGVTYSVSFSYKTLIGNPLRFSLWQEGVYESRPRGEEGLNAPLYLIGKEVDLGSSWQVYSKEFTWKSTENKGRVVFSLPAGSGKSVSLLDDLKVERVSDLDFLLEPVAPVSKSPVTIPKIAFTKINPTKYKVTINGAAGPYTLVFSESFNKGWKAYVSDSKPVSNQSQKVKSPVYFGGDVVEIPSQDSWASPTSFENWFAKPIDESRHLLVNGYANSWHILPSDAKGRSDYEITIEFRAQRLFMIGVIISAFAVVAFLIFLAVLFVKRKTAPKNNLSQVSL